MEERTASEELWYFLSREKEGEYNITVRLDVFNEFSTKLITLNGFNLKRNSARISAVRCYMWRNVTWIDMWGVLKFLFKYVSVVVFPVRDTQQRFKKDVEESSRTKRHLLKETTTCVCDS